MKAVWLVIAATVLGSSSIFAFYYLKLFFVMAAAPGPPALRARGRFLLLALLALAICLFSGWFLGFILSKA